MLPGFEMWIWETEEDVCELGAMEEVGKEFHGIGAEDGNVAVGRGYWIRRYGFGERIVVGRFDIS